LEVFKSDYRSAEGVEGIDLSYCILGREGPEPEAAFMMGTGAVADWEDGHEWRALRNKRYTYAIYRVDSKEFLFDNIEDPYQMKNLAEDPYYKEILEYFRSLLKRKMEELGNRFEASTWYRDNWTKDRIILRTATLKG
jgi:arylsulfatase A-like enzyme